MIFGGLVGFTVLLAVSTLDALSANGGSAARVTHHLPLLAAGGLALAVFLAAATWLAWRYPDWAMPLVVVLAPLRIELPLGSTTSDLLIPLYLVLLAVAIAELLVRDRLRVPDERRRDPVRLALAAMIAVIGCSALWVVLHRWASADKGFADALVKLFAFYLPFGVLSYLVYRYVDDVRRLWRLLVTFVGAGAVLAVIGIVQYPTHIVIVNRAGIEHDLALQHTFRANSLFWDPNIYGRFLGLVMLVGIALHLAIRLREPGRERTRGLWLTGGAVGLAAVALVVTFSRSSLAGLLLGAVVLELAWLGRRRGTIAALLTVLVLAGGMVGLTAVRHPQAIRTKLTTTQGLNKITGGRVYLIEAGVFMFERSPLDGLGLAQFPLAYPYFRHTHRATLAVRDSHTTVLTVAAEQGTIGLIAFAGLLATFFATTLRRRRFGADRRLYLWQAGLVACVVSIFVHSMTYNAFFEDPYLWLFAALASAAAVRLAAGPGGQGAAAAEPGGPPAEPGADAPPATTAAPAVAGDGHSPAPTPAT